MGPRIRRRPVGDDRDRLTCPECGYVAYENPKIIVGAVCTWGESFLLVRRAIAPQRGFWSLPAGYMELNESSAHGAAREVWEEAGARVEIGPLLALFNLPHLSQVHLIYRATMLSPEHVAGPESQEVCLVPWARIPWDHLAYPSIRWTLDHWQATRHQDSFAPLIRMPEPPTP